MFQGRILKEADLRRTAPNPHRTTRRIVAAALAMCLPAGTPAVTGAASPVTQERPTFGVDTAAVVLDVVIRDKKKKAVRDLTADDFEVYEDGVKQSLVSFQVIDNAPLTSTASTAEAEAPPATSAARPIPPGAPAAAPAKASGAPSVIALVFDRLSPNARALANKTALAYVNRGFVPGDMVAVFSIDLALRTLQPFTNDVEAIRSALQAAASQGHTAFASERDAARGREAGVRSADAALGALGGAAGQASSNTQTTAAGIAAQQAFDRVQAGMLRTFDALERDQQGLATTNGLLAVVNGLKSLPGRKTAVFFSEGLNITTNVQAQFRSVVAVANRANVSIYAVDAGGLRTASGVAEAREEIVQAARDRARQEATGNYRDSGALNRGLERNEEILRLSPEGGLGQLAAETGGFLVRDTNDAASSFLRIAEDMRFHYVLSYAPTNPAFDGSYRNISVKVRRPGLEVQARRGYFAVRPQDVVPVRSFEAAALAQLDRSPRPEAFPMRVGVLSFPERDRPGLAPVLVELPAKAVTWAPEGGGGFRASFAVVVRIRDAEGREADRVGQDYNLTAPADKLEAARRGNVLFYREAVVPPGRYTAEAVAYDTIAGTGSVRVIPFEVPKPEEGRLRLSSLVLVNRAEKLDPSELGGNPLHFGETILYPSLGAPFAKKAMPALGFYFSVYGPAPGGSRSATVEIRQGSRVVGSSTSALAAPDPTGRVQHAGTLPLQPLPAGAYTLRVTVSDGRSTESREALFEVVD